MEKQIKRENLTARAAYKKDGHEFTVEERRAIDFMMLVLFSHIERAKKYDKKDIGSLDESLATRAAKAYKVALEKLSEERNNPLFEMMKLQLFVFIDHAEEMRQVQREKEKLLVASEIGEAKKQGVERAKQRFSSFEAAADPLNVEPIEVSDPAEVKQKKTKPTKKTVAPKRTVFSRKPVVEAEKEVEYPTGMSLVDVLNRIKFLGEQTLLVVQYESKTAVFEALTILLSGSKAPESLDKVYRKIQASIHPDRHPELRETVSSFQNSVTNLYSMLSGKTTPSHEELIKDTEDLIAATENLLLELPHSFLFPPSESKETAKAGAVGASADVIARLDSLEEMVGKILGVMDDLRSGKISLSEIPSFKASDETIFELFEPKAKAALERLERLKKDPRYEQARFTALTQEGGQTDIAIIPSQLETILENKKVGEGEKLLGKLNVTLEMLEKKINEITPPKVLSKTVVKLDSGSWQLPQDKTLNKVFDDEGDVVAFVMKDTGTSSKVMYINQEYQKIGSGKSYADFLSNAELAERFERRDQNVGHRVWHRIHENPYGGEGLIEEVRVSLYSQTRTVMGTLVAFVPTEREANERPSGLDERIWSKIISKLDPLLRSEVRVDNEAVGKPADAKIPVVDSKIPLQDRLTSRDAEFIRIFGEFESEEVLVDPYFGMRSEVRFQLTDEAEKAAVIETATHVTEGVYRVALLVTAQALGVIDQFITSVEAAPYGTARDKFLANAPDLYDQLLALRDLGSAKVSDIIVYGPKTSFEHAPLLGALDREAALRIAFTRETPAKAEAFEIAIQTVNAVLQSKGLSKIEVVKGVGGLKSRLAELRTVGYEGRSFSDRDFIGRYVYAVDAQPLHRAIKTLSQIEVHELYNQIASVLEGLFRQMLQEELTRISA